MIQSNPADKLRMDSHFPLWQATSTPGTCQATSHPTPPNITSPFFVKRTTRWTGSTLSRSTLHRVAESGHWEPSDKATMVRTLKKETILTLRLSTVGLCERANHNTRPGCQCIQRIVRLTRSRTRRRVHPTGPTRNSHHPNRTFER